MFTRTVLRAPSERLYLIVFCSRRVYSCKERRNYFDVIYVRVLLIVFLCVFFAISLHATSCIHLDLCFVKREEIVLALTYSSAQYVHAQR